MKGLVVECVFLLVLLAIPSTHQLDQRGALKKLLKAKRSHNINMNTKWSSRSYTVSSSRAVESVKDQKQSDIIDLIKALPGQPSNVKFKQYGGYVTVDSSSGRALFYYFSEAIEDPSTKPLLLWLNGGPGCSSFGIGAMGELGPFRVNPDGKTLSTNPYGWNQVANTLFLESPAGVGFSYSNTSTDYGQSGDKRTAEDSYTFLLNWFERFPQYKSRAFYIAGESYAGHYIPELADTIIKRNNQSQNSYINFKGIMVGNGIMNSETDNKGSDDYLWTHALISDDTYNGMQMYCNYSIGTSNSVECNEYQDISQQEVGNIDPYNIYAPLCSATSTSSGQKTLRSDTGPRQSAPEYDPCSENYVSTYLNTQQVQEALHANVTALSYPWEGCSTCDIIMSNLVLDPNSSLINGKWNDSPRTMFPIYNDLMAAGLQILIYSGDVDAVVPVTSTRYSINGLKLPIKKSWYPWMNGDEVGGYSVIYEGLTFATVRGAGHEVPSFQPARALSMAKFFLAGKPLPSSDQ
eukprot:Gb_10864 [translate_table: standard]